MNEDLDQQLDPTARQQDCPTREATMQSNQRINARNSVPMPVISVLGRPKDSSEGSKEEQKMKDSMNSNFDQSNGQKSADMDIPQIKVLESDGNERDKLQKKQLLQTVPTNKMGKEEKSLDDEDKTERRDNSEHQNPKINFRTVQEVHENPKNVEESKVEPFQIIDEKRIRLRGVKKFFGLYKEPKRCSAIHAQLTRDMTEKEGQDFLLNIVQQYRSPFYEEDILKVSIKPSSSSVAVPKIKSQVACWVETVILSMELKDTLEIMARLQAQQGLGNHYAQFLSQLICKLRNYKHGKAIPVIFLLTKPSLQNEAVSEAFIDLWKAEVRKLNELPQYSDAEFKLVVANVIVNEQAKNKTCIIEKDQEKIFGELKNIIF